MVGDKSERGRHEGIITKMDDLEGFMHGELLGNNRQGGRHELRLRGGWDNGTPINLQKTDVK